MQKDIEQKKGRRAKELIPIDIEFLYWRECPSWEIVLERLRKVVEEIEKEAREKNEHLKFKVSIREIKNEREAEKLKFPGSPTIRVLGQDIDPEGEKQNIVGLTCRAYKVHGKITPTPSEEFIKERIFGIIKEKILCGCTKVVFKILE